MKRTRIHLFAIASLLLTLPLFARDDVRHNVSAAADAGAVTRVVVDVPYAHLTIQNGDAKTIDTYGYVARSWRTTKQRDNAQAILADTNIRIDIEGSTAYVRRHHGIAAESRSAKGSKSTFVLAVRVPAGTSLVVRQKKGSVTAKGDFANIDSELSSGNVVIEVPKKNVGELIARTRYGLLQVHLGDRVIENEGFMPRKAHYFYEGGRNVLTAIVTRGDISIKLMQ